MGVHAFGSQQRDRGHEHAALCRAEPRAPSGVLLQQNLAGCSGDFAGVGAAEGSPATTHLLSGAEVTPTAYGIPTKKVS